MLAIRQHTFGGPEVLVPEEVPEPEPGAGQVRIRVAAAGVQLLDAVLRAGGSPGRPMPPPALPVTPGREVAGTVDAVGHGVDPALLGLRVVADLGTAGGGYAQAALADAAALHRLPAGLDADQAVAMVGTGRTAMAVMELAAPTPGDLAVVTSAAGGVGTLLVQVLRNAGAEVVGLARGADKLDLVRSLGATAVDYAEPQWPAAVSTAVGGRPVTLAVDGVGGAVGRDTMELLGVGGRLVMFGSASGTLTELSAGDVYVRGITVCAAVGARILQRPGGLRPLEERALRAAAHGQLTPVVGLRFALK
ncbi:zinc-binding dehydrogenase, partial [Actinacidiphila bryophytorum]